MKMVVKSLTLTLIVLTTLPALGMGRAFRLAPLMGNRVPARTFFSRQIDMNSMRVKFHKEWNEQQRKDAEKEAFKSNTPYGEALRGRRFWRAVSGFALTGFGVSSYASLCFHNECTHLEDMAVESWHHEQQQQPVKPLGA